MTTVSLVSASSRGGGHRRTSESRDGWMLVTPTVLVTVAIIVLPILWNIVLAFQDTTFKSIREEGIFGGGFTLDNVIDTVTAPSFWQSLWVTVVYSVGSTLGSIIIGLIAAIALRSAFKGRGFVRAMMLLPYVAPVVAVTFVWRTILHPQYGVVNQYLPGSSIDFLGIRPWALITVIIFEIWRYFPFAFLFISARLVGLSRDIEEAALVDGVTPWQNFRYVVAPQLMPTLSLLAILRLIMTFNKFDDIYLLTGGASGTEVAAVRVYNELMGSGNISGSAATAVVLALVMCVFLVVYFRATRRSEES